MDVAVIRTARDVALERWGVVTVWLGSKTGRPTRCAKCGGRFKHRRFDCTGILPRCIGYHAGRKPCAHEASASL